MTKDDDKASGADTLAETIRIGRLAQLVKCLDMGELRSLATASGFKATHMSRGDLCRRLTTHHPTELIDRVYGKCDAAEVAEKHR